VYYGSITKPLNLSVDGSAKKPLAEQIRHGITTAIESGVLEPGARLPSWQDLAAQLGVARGTVRTAYEKLDAAQLCEPEVSVTTPRSAPEVTGSTTYCLAAAEIRSVRATAPA
jgi:DNA-binding transcriptional regulator YhcF (GntR family)